MNERWARGESSGFRVRVEKLTTHEGERGVPVRHRSLNEVSERADSETD
jgi:hypothetical protein